MGNQRSAEYYPVPVSELADAPLLEDGCSAKEQCDAPRPVLFRVRQERVLLTVILVQAIALITVLSASWYYFKSELLSCQCQRPLADRSLLYCKDCYFSLYP